MGDLSTLALAVTERRPTLEKVRFDIQPALEFAGLAIPIIEEVLQSRWRIIRTLSAEYRRYATFYGTTRRSKLTGNQSQQRRFTSAISADDSGKPA